jgi:DUF1009 family protein
MELTYLVYAFSLGLIVGSGLFSLGLVIGRLQAGGGIISSFKKEEIVALEDVPGTDEYYEKARKAPDEGGHANPFEDDLIDLGRHSE